MNALYVTVSIPLLLVLAGFNHAHGLTTFGKSNNQGNQNQPHPPAQMRSCQSQANCTFIKGTTCLRNYCLCGDNTHPVNGKCKDALRAPRHHCDKDDDCIEGADCLPPKVKNSKGILEPSTTADYKICTCQEGLIELRDSCKASCISILTGLVLLTALISRTMN